MKYEVNFGRMLPAQRRAGDDSKFRIAILADLSGRANQGKLATGDELASTKPIRVDVDNLDEIIQRLDIQLQLPISDDGGNVRVPLTEMDSFHPDELYENLSVFAKLSGLRAKLGDTATFAATSRAVSALLGTETASAETTGRASQAARGSAIPNAKLSDFATLVGRPAADVETPINNLIKGLIRPHVVAAVTPQQEQMVATIDEALSDTMRRVLHHPDFQSLESIWRSIDLLVRRLETDSDLQIVLYDISAEEIAADLSRSDDLAQSGLFKLLAEQPLLDAQQGGLSVLIGNYTFDQTPPHADLLGRMAKVAAAAGAPFIASMSNECLKRNKPEDLPPVVTQAWEQLRSLPEASYLALAVPRFMLRWPFGKKTEPIDAFEFEEFTNRSGIAGMLWGNPAFIAGLLLGQTYRKSGLQDMKLGSILGVDDLPFYYYIDADGDQVALPCTDRLLSESLAAHVNSQGFIPLLSIKGRPEVRLGGLGSLAGTSLSGPWAPVASHSGPSVAAPTAAADAASETPSTDSQPPAIDTVDPAVEADDELDALLADLEGDVSSASPAESVDAPATSSAGVDNDDNDDDAELDALLADLGGESDDASSEDGMDPDLAALLADL